MPRKEKEEEEKLLKWAYFCTMLTWAYLEHNFALYTCFGLIHNSQVCTCHLATTIFGIFFDFFPFFWIFPIFDFFCIFAFLCIYKKEQKKYMYKKEKWHSGIESRNKGKNKGWHMGQTRFQANTTPIEAQNRAIGRKLRPRKTMNEGDEKGKSSKQR